MITLDELKARLIKEYDLQPPQSCGSSSSFYPSLTVMAKLSEMMMDNEEKVMEIEEQIADGEEFRIYFSDRESMKELMKMHDEDVDRFYRILHKEELFLNTCLQTFGFKNIMISLNPDTLLSNLEDEIDEDDPDEPEEDEEL